MNSLVEFFIKIFGGLNKEVVIFIISLFPILELRGGMLAATLLHIPFVRALVICLIGNLLPIPFILMFLEFILSFFIQCHFRFFSQLLLERPMLMSYLECLLLQLLLLQQPHYRQCLLLEEQLRFHLAKRHFQF